MHLHQRLLRSRHGGYARAIFTLVAPLAELATDTRTADTSGQLDLFCRADAQRGGAEPGSPAASGAVAPLIDRPHADLRRGDVDSANDRRTRRTAITPGSRASETGIRTTTTRTTGAWRGRSAKWEGAGLFYSDWLAAWDATRRHKRNTASALAFEEHAEERLAELHDAVADGTYVPGRSICFIIDRPRHREVWAADFPDRVVHHAWYREIGPRFEPSFIVDSCACIEGRGTLYAARRLEAKVRSITRNWTRRAFYLKCDVRNFFPSIDKNILFALLERRIPEPFWLDLTERILFHDPRPDVDLRGDRARLALIPPEKSLFGRPAHLGLPIGNLPSQFGANVYLNELDQLVKHRLRAPHYVRYVDDFILLHESPQPLNAWRAAIEAFLPDRLGVELNASKTILQPIERGVDFVGHVLKPHRRTIRRRTFHAAMARLADMPGEDVPEAATSYLGLLRQATHSRRDRARICNLVRRRGFAIDHAFTKVYP